MEIPLSISLSISLSLSHTQMNTHYIFWLSSSVLTFTIQQLCNLFPAVIWSLNWKLTLVIHNLNLVSHSDIVDMADPEPVESLAPFLAVLVSLSYQLSDLKTSHKSLIRDGS